MRICDDLRQAVLQAAIQGKLTKQLPEDGNAADLLKLIATEKAKLIKEGKIKKEKALPEISADEALFDVPENWTWARLGHCISLLSGADFSPDNYNNKQDGIPYMTGASNIEDGHLVINRWTPSPRCLAYKNDLLIVCKGSGYGKTVICDIEVCHVARQFMAVRYSRFLNQKFIKTFIDYSFSYIKTKGQGIIPGIERSTILSLAFPLPPLAEQHRIVARVEELMARIDNLEKTETELEKLKAAFPGDMKAALLQAAMQGKLTEQLPEDGNAANLINQIAKEKSQLIKEGKIKKEKPLPEITSNEMPFDIPENWVWVRLGSITYNRGQKNPDKDFTYIDIGSIDNKTNRLGDLTNILSPNQAPSRARKIVQNGDIIYSTVRPYLHNTCIIDRDIYPEPIVSTGFAVLSVTKGIYNKYLFRCLLSPMFDQYANSNENAKGVAYPAINDAKLMAAYIPLPPLAEQKRIVEKLDKLLPLCDGLVEE